MGGINIKGTGCIREINVPVKLMPIASCLKRHEIYVSISFNRLGVAIRSIQKKSLIVIYTSQTVTPLHRAVGSPMNPLYGGLVLP